MLLCQPQNNRRLKKKRNASSLEKELFNWGEPLSILCNINGNNFCASGKILQRMNRRVVFCMTWNELQENSTQQRCTLESAVFSITFIFLLLANNQEALKTSLHSVGPNFGISTQCFLCYTHSVCSLPFGLHWSFSSLVYQMFVAWFLQDPSLYWTGRFW